MNTQAFWESMNSNCLFQLIKNVKSSKLYKAAYNYWNGSGKGQWLSWSILMGNFFCLKNELSRWKESSRGGAGQIGILFLVTKKGKITFQYFQTNNENTQDIRYGKKQFPLFG